MKDGIRILLIDDEESFRETIKIILSRFDCVIQESETGEDALKKLAIEDFDVILLDINLPGMNGIDMLKNAKTDFINLPPVIVLTEEDDYQIAFDAGKLEAFRFKLKLDLDKEELKKDINAAMRKKQSFNRIEVKRCFKHNQGGCNTVINISKNLVFVGIPFKPFNMRRIYFEGIKATVESKEINLTCQRADEFRRLGDFSCKICAIIQGCNLAVFDISTLSPNVLIELGFAYSSGKDVLILKKKNVETPSNLEGIELIEYSNIVSLKNQLSDYLVDYLKEKQFSHFSE